MSDRGFLFLFSILMIAVGAATVAYLIATGQALTLDGLFLTLTALILAAGFGLYLIYMIRRAMEPAKPAVPAAKPAAATAPAKGCPGSELVRSGLPCLSCFADTYCFAGVAAFFGAAVPAGAADFLAGAAAGAGGGP